MKKGQDRMIAVMTQNKNSFLSVKEISVKENYIEGIVERRFFIEWKKTLGMYETNARALEVLEELYEKINKKNDTMIHLAMPLK